MLTDLALPAVISRGGFFAAHDRHPRSTRASNLGPTPGVHRTSPGSVAISDAAARAHGRSTSFSGAIDELLAGEGPTVVDLRNPRNVVSIPYRRLRLGMDV